MASGPSAARLEAQLKLELEDAIAAPLNAHPDAPVFLSLPRSGTVRAARLPAGTGDCRARYPGAAALAGAAGLSPVTRRSGKWISHDFRWNASPHLRDAWCDFAGDTRHASPRAASIYDAARGRGKDHPHAVRILACAWTTVVWPCWQQGIPYHPGRHRALQDIPARHPGQQQ